MSTEAVDYVFRTLAATYGAEWDRSLGNAPIGDVKSVWADALDGYTHTDAAKRTILWALKNLPERAPNVRQFVALCRMAPAPDVPKLPEPKADPDRVKSELAKLGNLRKVVASNNSEYDPKAWARRILDSHAQGFRINRCTLQMARYALRGAA